MGLERGVTEKEWNCLFYTSQRKRAQEGRKKVQE